MANRHVNSDKLATNPAYSHAVIIEGPCKTIYVGGQNGIDSTGKLATGLAAQSEQALKNVLEVLRVAGATQEDVVKLTILIVQGGDIQEAFAAAQKVWGLHATAVTGAFVAALALPGALVEVDAIAAVKS